MVPNYIEALRDENNGGDLSVYKVDGNKGNRPFVGIITIEIVKKAQELYTMYVEDDVRYKNKKYCLNFPKLEKICNKYELDHPAQY